MFMELGERWPILQNPKLQIGKADLHLLAEAPLNRPRPVSSAVT